MQPFSLPILTRTCLKPKPHTVNSKPYTLNPKPTLHRQANEAFPGNACIPCREYVHQLQRSLAQCALDTFREFEDAVEKDSTRTPVVDGTVHPLTSYVINYVKFLFE